jgi:hypothetical protein
VLFFVVFGYEVLYLTSLTGGNVLIVTPFFTRKVSGKR